MRSEILGQLQAYLAEVEETVAISGLHSEGVVPVPPPHQQARVGRGGVLHKVGLGARDDEVPTPHRDQALRDPVVPLPVSTNGVQAARGSNEVALLTGGALRDLAPKEKTGVRDHLSMKTT